MKTTIKNISTNKGDVISDGNIIQIYNEKADPHDLLLSKEELKYVKKQIKDDKAIVSINQLNRFVHFVNLKGKTDINKYAEDCRMLGDKLHALVKDNKNIHLLFDKTYTEEGLLIAEGLALANYTFTKHKTDPKPNKLENIYLSNHDEIKEDVA